MSKSKLFIYSVAVVLAVCSAGFSAVTYPQVTIKVTGAVTGDIVIELYPDKAPVTVANFLSYVKSGFYTDLIFHRVINNFMVQTGAYDQDLYTPNKYNKPGYFDNGSWMNDPNFYHTGNAPIVNECRNGLSNLQYTVAMARTNAPDSASSQFFINHVNNASQLDYVPVVYDYYGSAYSKYGYAVFGKVISGTAVVNAIAAVSTKTIGTNPDPDLQMANVPVNVIKIQQAFVSVNGPVCVQKLAGDVDGNCRVDLKDFSLMADNWLDGNSML